MQAETTFSGLGIKSKTLTGNKIAIEDVLDHKIKIIAYKISDSQYGKRNTEPKYLCLQIKFNDEIRVIFTGSTVLMEDIIKAEELQKANNEKFGFYTTIIRVTAQKDNKQIKWYKFT